MHLVVMVESTLPLEPEPRQPIQQKDSETHTHRAAADSLPSVLSAVGSAKEEALAKGGKEADTSRSRRREEAEGRDFPEE
jgi:hypothetical protein